ncbi:MAG: ribbon-helix-helix protein, CopG family [Tetrasphaera sp.]
MRTTVEFDPDTAKAVEQLRREQGKGVSEAVNELIRRGLLAEGRREPFVPRTHHLGIRIDVSNVAEALDFLEGPSAR